MQPNSKPTYANTDEGSLVNTSSILQGFKTLRTRRELLSNCLLLAGGVAISGWSLIGCRGGEDSVQISFLGGELLDTMDFEGEGSAPMNETLGSELDGRLFFDHSFLSAGNLLTPSDKFYVRTRASALLDSKRPWFVKLGDPKGYSHLPVRELVERSKPVGLHLMECAGNAGGSHFGLMSVANWEGVPISEILSRIGMRSRSSRVLISGFDDYASHSTTSIPGASWVFLADDLIKTVAFLATKMNGSTLARDHGAPVRFVMPGWYGCCCIKWVNEITAVDDDAATTSQMQEYATRTHQDGTPAFAREYEPAIIEAAAMPIRVEKWRVKGQIRYKVVGIHWGGVQPLKTLKIRFNEGADWHLVEQVDGKAGDSWALWTHPWSPREPGLYKIRLKVDDPNVRTRRLDMGYYDRVISIPAD